jgi:hypothetical protein
VVPISLVEKTVMLKMALKKQDENSGLDENS